MKISVVTVAMNSAKTIGRTVESFVRQSHPSKELVLIDGASHDGTVDLVRSIAGDGVVVVSERDHGIYDAMNKGLKTFSGDVVGFLNSDDSFAHGDVLSEIEAALADADIAFGNIDFVAGGSKTSVVRRWRCTPYRSGAFAAGWMPPHPAFYVRRVVVDAVGPFDTNYRIGGDYDFMLRAMELNSFRVAFVNRVLVCMAVGGKSTRGFGAYVRGNLEALHSRRVWLGSGAVDLALVAKPLNKLHQFLPRPWRDTVGAGVK